MNPFKLFNKYSWLWTFALCTGGLLLKASAQDLREQIIVSEVNQSSCAQCNGKISVKLPLGMALPLQVSLRDAGSTSPKTLHYSELSEVTQAIFDEVCPGPYTITVSIKDPKFEDQSCAILTKTGILKGNGQANFAVTLVSNVNNLLQISTTALNPSFKWSNGETTQDLSVKIPGDYTVTVTDIAGCAKIAGPFSAKAECYSANGTYIGEKFEIGIAGMTDKQEGIFSSGADQTLRVTFAGGTALPAGYTIKWLLSDGTVLGNANSITIPYNQFSNYKSVKVVVNNACEQRERTIKLQACGEVLKDPTELFDMKVEPSCYYRSLGSGTSIVSTDNRTGKITLSIPIPAGMTQQQIVVSLASRKFTASSVDSKGRAVFVLDRLYSFESAQTILVEFGACKFSFQAVVPKKEAKYFEDVVLRYSKDLDAYDPVKNLCNFTATCSTETNPSKDVVNPPFLVSFPPIKFISRSQTFDRSVSKRKCEKVAVCGAGSFSYEARLHQLPFEERLVDAVTTYAGIFNEVLNSIITDPKIKLTPAEKEFMIEKLCADNKDRQRCRKVRFCPGSFEVIDDSAPGGPLFGRRKNSDQLSEDGKCWELDCGRGRGREMLSTCDPELAQVVKIIAPVGPTGGVCLDVEDRDDTSDNTDGENGKKCEKYEYTRTTAAQLLAANSPDELNIIPGSQLERIYWLLKNRADALDQLLERAGTGASRLACYKIKYCTITQIVRNFRSLERDIIDEDCQTCSNADMVYTNLYDLVRKLPNNPIGADFRYLKRAYGFDPASTPFTYRCVPIEYCPGTNIVKRIDKVSDLVRQVTTFDCPNCTAISVRFNVLVGIYFRKDRAAWRELIGENEQYEDFILEGEDLEKLILKNGRYHSSTYEGCPIIQFCKETNKVFNFRKMDDYLFNSTCNHLFHEGDQNNHTISFGSNLFSQQNEVEPRSPKYFEDFPANEVFNMFTPQISGGFFSGKAAISNEKTGKYYNFSHDVKPLQVLKDSAIIFKYDNWDTDQYWYIDRMNSNREYWISHDEEAGYWGAPIESDSLLQFSKIEVQDSIAYMSGIFTGALRFRGQLLSSDFPHDRISAFVLALRTNGTVKGVHIFQGIDTLYGGFSFALGNAGKILVSGQKAVQHALKHNGTELNLLGRTAFFGAIEQNTQFFQLIQAPDLGSGRILTMAVSLEGDDVGLLIGPSTPITWSNNTLKADPGTGFNIVSIDPLGALNWSQHISGALDLRQRDLKYGYQKRIIFAYTYQGAVNVADSLIVNSNGKEDIGLIQFSNTGGIRWHKNYGTPETETVKALLYNYGVVYFGGDFKGNQSVRSVGEYDFHNTTQYPNRAYVSYVLDSLSIQDTTGVTYEIAAYQAPKFASHISNKNTLKAYPNPFQNQITAEFILDTPGEITLQLFNQLGNVVELRKINANDGLNREQISTNSLPSGLYFLHLHDAQNRQIGVQKILKM